MQNTPRDARASMGRAHGYFRRALRKTLMALVASVGLYAAVLAAVWGAQERLIFSPVVIEAARRLSVESDVQERMVDVPGARLSVLELRLPDPKGVVFFLHGNGGNLESWFVNTALYRDANFDLVMLDYRGYGKSTGRIENEAQLHADVRAVWDGVAARYAGRKVVFYGRSLGTGLAAALAAALPADAQPALTMLVSPYTSMVALASEHYPWVPSALLRYRLRTDEVIARVKSPVLLVHGDGDTLIPLSNSRLLERLSPSARLVVIPGANHNDLQAFDSYRQAVFGALRAL